MAERSQSHVPKFGNWDGDNVPYTAYFENARREKAVGVRINPNDPEENPEAFMNFGGGNNSVQGANRVSPDKFYRRNGNTNDQEGSFFGYRRGSSISSSEKSTSESSVTKPSHRRRSSDRSKHSRESHLPPRSPNHGVMNYSEDMSYRSVSVPKFGEWDEKDPRSAEGFTVIFNKVKEEKRIAASRLPPTPQQTAYDNQYKNTRSKKCCCLF